MSHGLRGSKFWLRPPGLASSPRTPGGSHVGDLSCTLVMWGVCHRQQLCPSLERGLYLLPLSVMLACTACSLSTPGLEADGAQPWAMGGSHLWLFQPRRSRSAGCRCWCPRRTPGRHPTPAGSPSDRHSQTSVQRTGGHGLRLAWQAASRQHCPSTGKELGGLAPLVRGSARLCLPTAAYCPGDHILAAGPRQAMRAAGHSLTHTYPAAAQHAHAQGPILPRVLWHAAGPIQEVVSTPHQEVFANCPAHMSAQRVP